MPVTSATVPPLTPGTVSTTPIRAPRSRLPIGFGAAGATGRAVTRQGRRHLSWRQPTERRLDARRAPCRVPPAGPSDAAGARHARRIRALLRREVPGSAAPAPVPGHVPGGAGVVGLVGSGLRGVLVDAIGQDRPTVLRGGAACSGLLGLVPRDRLPGHRGDHDAARPAGRTPAAAPGVHWRSW